MPRIWRTASLCLGVAACNPDAFNGDLHDGPGDYRVLQVRACPADQPAPGGVYKVVEVSFSAAAISIDVIDGLLRTDGAEWGARVCRVHYGDGNRASDASVLVKSVAATSSPIVHVTAWDRDNCTSNDLKATMVDENWLSLSSEVSSGCSDGVIQLVDGGSSDGGSGRTAPDSSTRDAGAGAAKTDAPDEPKDAAKPNTDSSTSGGADAQP